MIALEGKTHYLGDGFFVTRLLPDARRRSVGPFLFFDYFGPVAFAPGKGIDVRPHPHVGLATVTYLFEGAQMHRDTLGSAQEIRPGDVNWMTAGRGIAHSERTGPETRAAGHRLHGIQTWVGLPTADEEAEPHFQHFKAEQLPEMERQDVKLRLIAGNGFGLSAPVKVFSPIFYADARFDTGGALTYPGEHEERAIFITEGQVQVNGDIHSAGMMLVLEKDEQVSMFADAPARVMLFGGAPLDGPRHLWWNFVSSSRERIERAKQEWKEGKFGLIPGDDKEFIPLPEDKRGTEDKK
ncbi:MAG TPA: pirin family protein [Rhizomicrobium sp.]|jgi:redox-sensitive bicupin YhaK (pirin superfamily)|nr:pirin family protein [Rhizomicrobium sp.]